MNENENVFEESEFVKIVPEDLPGDDDFDSQLDGRNGPMYHIRFCKSDLKILVDTRVVAELDYDKLAPGIDRSDYKVVMQLMKDLKEMTLETWLKKYTV